jgi:hypothetical protein
LVATVVVSENDKIPRTAMSLRTNRMVIGAVLAVGHVVACGSPGTAAGNDMYFAIVPDVGIVASGEITEDTPKVFEEFVRTRNVGPGQTVYLHSPGGSAIAGLGLGRAIRATQLSTRVGAQRIDRQNKSIIEPGDCISACVYAFIGGVERTMRDQDRLGIHRMSMSGGSNMHRGDATDVTQEVLSIIFTYVKSMGVSTDLVAASLDVEDWSMHYLTREEMREWAVVTGGPQIATTIAPPQPNGEDTVRNFYSALAAADGMRASSLMIPEKRRERNFLPEAIRKYYSENPLWLNEVFFWGENIYRAEYVLRTRTRLRECASLVTVVLRDGQTLIQRIKAQNGC